ncbi:extracellular sulfatase Sulf-1-like [Littorina saxatilis]|uniref:Uncharacterized protein n=1 Tax=Littorina saxatilis TaxID=31220 RepID=A0AAN9ARI4_9CAEN
MAANRLLRGQWPVSLLVIAVFLVVFSVCDIADARDRSEGQVRRRKILLDGEYRRSYQQIVQQSRLQKSKSPNIVLIITDDQDVLLGSLKVMPKLQRYMIDRGAYFNNSFTSTPMCCPSRSSMLTGLYVHNHNVFTNNDNCSSSQWVRDHEPYTFAPYLQKAGYKTGYFGKYLNKYNGTYTPAGWDKWIGLVRNSRFYNYTMSYGGQLQKHYDNYYQDYLTDLIANDSVAYFKRSKRLDRTKPVMMVLSVPAPHGPEDAAPQYQHMFVNNTDHRTPSWNIAPNVDKQWLLRRTDPMTPQYKIFTDLLQRRRLQTLQSVDDLVEKVYYELTMLDELDNTYIIYTSDHGYHLGQFGLIKGKSLAYDFDTRVPLIVSGPGVKPGIRISNLAANVDLAPTLLDMGGVPVPDHMDGTSLLPLLRASQDPQRSDHKDFVRPDKPWRDSILLERGKVSEKMRKIRMREKHNTLMQQNQNNLHRYLQPKQKKVLRQCSNPKKMLLRPCKPNQKWYCEKDHKGRTRLHKCRHSNRERNYNANTVLYQNDQPQTCMCRDGRKGLRIYSSSSAHTSLSGVTSSIPRRRRRRRLRQQEKRKARERLVRQRRSVMQGTLRISRGYEADPLDQATALELFTRRCRILANKTVSCDQDLYRDYQQWESYVDRLDEMIKEYRKILDDLRDTREYLLDNKPSMYEDLDDLDDNGDDLDTTLDGIDSEEDCFCDNETLPGRYLGERDERLRLRQERKELKKQRREERQRRKSSRRGKKKKNCNDQNMKCFSHDNDHWKTPPYWDYGPFCFCSNANNNTYWCMRTVNTTHDFLYCEYITLFIAYYDMLTDPFQLQNIARKLNYGVLQQLHEELALLKVCQGRENCNLRNLKGKLRKTPTRYEGSSGEGDSSDDGDIDDYDDDDYDPHGLYDEEEEAGKGEYDFFEEADPDFF